MRSGSGVQSTRKATDAGDGVTEREVTTEDGSLRFVISDPLEEYRVKTLRTKEPETIAWIDRWLSDDPGQPTQFWDVGSNIGIYTLYAASRNPRLRVMSFEPFFKNFVRLKANVELNRLGNVTPLFFALGNSTGLTPFAVRDQRFGASGNVLAAPGDAKAPTDDGSITEMMLQITGDDLLRMNLPAPNFLKIDVDGLEWEIIDGMRDVLATDALRSVLVEINSKADLEFIGTTFAALGFLPDDSINLREDHSRRRRAKDSSNTAENYVFTKS
jgi:FkbM family methyltransferase